MDGLSTLAPPLRRRVASYLSARDLAQLIACNKECANVFDHNGLWEHVAATSAPAHFAYLAGNDRFAATSQWKNRLRSWSRVQGAWRGCGLDARCLSLQSYALSPEPLFNALHLGYNKFALAGKDGMLRIVDASTAAELSALGGAAAGLHTACTMVASSDVSLGPITNVASLGSGAQLVTSHCNGALQIWNVGGCWGHLAHTSSKCEALAANVGTDEVCQRAWSRDVTMAGGMSPPVRRLAAMYAGRRHCADLSLAPLEMGRRALHRGPILDLAVDGEWVATSGLDKTAHLWNARTHSTMHTFTAHDAVLSAVNLSMAHNSLFTGGRDGSVFGHDLLTGAPVVRFQGEASAGVLTLMSSAPSRMSWRKAKCNRIMINHLHAATVASRIAAAVDRTTAPDAGTPPPGDGAAVADVDPAILRLAARITPPELQDVPINDALARGSVRGAEDVDAELESSLSSLAVEETPFARLRARWRVVDSLAKVHSAVKRTLSKGSPAPSDAAAPSAVIPPGVQDTFGMPCDPASVQAATLRGGCPTRERGMRAQGTSAHAARSAALPAASAQPGPLSSTQHKFCPVQKFLAQARSLAFVGCGSTSSAPSPSSAPASAASPSTSSPHATALGFVAAPANASGAVNTHESAATESDAGSGGMELESTRTSASAVSCHSHARDPCFVSGTKRACGAAGLTLGSTASASVAPGSDASTRSGHGMTPSRRRVSHAGSSELELTTDSDASGARLGFSSDGGDAESCGEEDDWCKMGCDALVDPAASRTGGSLSWLGQYQDLLFSGSLDGVIRMFDVRTNKHQFSTSNMGGAITCLRSQLDQHRFVSSSSAGSLQVWDVRKLMPVFALNNVQEAAKGKVSRFDISSDLLVAASLSGQMLVWDVNSV